MKRLPYSDVCWMRSCSRDYAAKPRTMLRTPADILSEVRPTDYLNPVDLPRAFSLNHFPSDRPIRMFLKAITEE